MSGKIDTLRQAHFPLDLGDGYRVVSAERKIVRGFLAEHYEKVFPKHQTAGPSRTLLVPPEREKAIAELMGLIGSDKVHQEYFLFTLNDEPVGWSTGETMDFMTYYMRNTGILPEHQKGGLYSRFLETFTSYIEAIGYERLTSQHKPDNAEILITKLKAGFIITGIELDERWGSLVRLTKFLKPDRENAFKLCFGRT